MTPYYAPVPVALIAFGQSNVREHADDGLADSVAQHGVISPITVVREGSDRYRVVVGHRRVAAARRARLETIPAVVVEDPGDPTLLQLVENVCRADLNPIERARALRHLVDGGLSQVVVARQLGLDPSTVSNDLRLLTIDPTVQTAIAEKRITRAHAVALAGQPHDEQRRLALLAENGASAHEIERIGSESGRGSRSVVVRLREGLVTVGADADGHRVDLIVETKVGHRVMVGLTPDQAAEIGRMLRLAATAVRA